MYNIMIHRLGGIPSPQSRVQAFRFIELLDLDVLFAVPNKELHSAILLVFFSKAAVTPEHSILQTSNAPFILVLYGKYLHSGVGLEVSYNTRFASCYMNFSTYTPRAIISIEYSQRCIS